MKRRSFLKAIGLAPTVTAFPVLAKTELLEWHPEIYNYGNYGIQEMRFNNTETIEVTVKTYYPDNDWLNEKQCIIENKFIMNVHGQGVVPDPCFVVPVNELTEVKVFIGDRLAHKFKPKWENDKFKDVFIV